MEDAKMEYEYYERLRLDEEKEQQDKADKKARWDALTPQQKVKCFKANLVYRKSCNDKYVASREEL